MCMICKAIKNKVNIIEKYIDCRECPFLKSIPDGMISENVKNIYIRECKNLVSLGKLPEMLDTIHISSCPKIELPSLPSELTSFVYDYNYEAKIPILPKNLRLFHCNSNYLKKLPDLPEGLLSLECSSCYHLKDLGKLPVSLSSLRCSSISVEKIEASHSGLIWLECNGCSKLKTISIPMSLTVLECQRCPKLMYYGTLNNITNLKCGNSPGVILKGRFRRLNYLDFSGLGPWIKGNKEYKENIKKLKVIQRSARKYLFRKKFNQRIAIKKNTNLCEDVVNLIYGEYL